MVMCSQSQGQRVQKDILWFIRKDITKEVLTDTKYSWTFSALYTSDTFIFSTRPPTVAQVRRSYPNGRVNLGTGAKKPKS